MSSALPLKALPTAALPRADPLEPVPISPGTRLLPSATPALPTPDPVPTRPGTRLLPDADPSPTAALPTPEPADPGPIRPGTRPLPVADPSSTAELPATALPAQAVATLPVSSPNAATGFPISISPRSSASGRAPPGDRPSGWAATQPERALQEAALVPCRGAATGARPPRRAAGRARRSVTSHTLRRNSIRYGKGNVAFEIRSIFGPLGAVTGPRSTIARPRRAPAHDFIDQWTDVGGLRSRGTAQRQRGQDGRRGERRCGRMFLDEHPTPRIRRQSTCW